MQGKAIILHNKTFDHSNPDEADVIRQVELVSKAFREMGREFEIMDMGTDPFADMKKVKDAGPEFVFNLVESVYDKGELTYIGAALLNSMQIRYTGVPLEALFLTTSKVLAKRYMNLHQIPTPDFFPLGSIHSLEPSRRYILKPVWEEGSVGLDEDAVFTVQDEDMIRKFSSLSSSHYFIEEYVEGREFNISMLGGTEKKDILCPAEMIFTNFPEGKPKILGYKAKWDEQSVEYRNTTRSFNTLEKDSALYNRLEKICHRCWDSFHLNGYARVDFRVDIQGNPLVLEINGNPCISDDSGFMAAARHDGYTDKTVIQRIAEELN